MTNSQWTLIWSIGQNKDPIHKSEDDDDDGDDDDDDFFFFFFFF